MFLHSIEVKRCNGLHKSAFKLEYILSKDSQLTPTLRAIFTVEHFVMLSVLGLHPSGPCFKALLALPRPIPVGTFVPTCDYDGYYSHQQTWGSTGESWCVTREGNEIARTRTKPGQPPFDCSKGTTSNSSQGLIQRV